ncbi:hypothetical protein L1987_18549 [Smallanthus sonchifolius]|uniref:Uncharacterized protein n=1 Tax=Smallanthus sonchifolius TaxID=185202 RepID=A0ACB9J0V9_9ASTR|nr:hypothetical protein L1987_18549 [Smallanthus sonchifolius]
MDTTVLDDLDSEDNIGGFGDVSTPIQGSNDEHIPPVETSFAKVDKTGWFKTAEPEQSKIFQNLSKPKRQDTMKIISWMFNHLRGM